MIFKGWPRYRSNEYVVKEIRGSKVLIRCIFDYRMEGAIIRGWADQDRFVVVSGDPPDSPIGQRSADDVAY